MCTTLLTLHQHTYLAIRIYIKKVGSVQILRLTLGKTYFFQFAFYLKNYFRKKRKCNWNNKYIFRLKPQSFQC